MPQGVMIIKSKASGWKQKMECLKVRIQIGINRTLVYQTQNNNN